MMLEGNWEDVSGELETAAVSCDTFVPYDAFEGIVNLFSYYEPLPAWEWMSARNSLLFLSKSIRKSQMDMLRNLDGPYRMETSRSIDFMVERLEKASKMFEPGGFYMPPKDPRDKVDREGRGRPRMPEPRPFAGAKGPPNEEAYRRRLVMGTLRREAQMAVEAAGGRALALLERVDGELEVAENAASPDVARSKALRQLLRELHPDRNPDNQADVRPVFEYVVKLRDETK
uniref:J domain-containing protein n=1 Tax=Alexandrium catenella TaxID=2925 RepID=A0A7S1QGP2_ALECA